MWAVLVVGVAWATDPFGFSTGEHPVDLDTTSDEPVWTDASECADCHQEAAEQWSASRHSVAWTNDLMQAGFVAEARLFCVYCHAPSTAQVAEVTANMATYRALSPTAPPHGAAPGALLPEPKAEEGISCVVCHLRNGEVLSANPPDPESPHPIRTDPTFGTEAACVTCHQFPAPSFVDGRTIPSDQPMQATVAEWEAWRAETGERDDCTDCHMPYKRDGALKISDHHIRSPLLNVQQACLQCHHFSEGEMLSRAEAIQDRTRQLMDRAQAALEALLDAIASAKARGVRVGRLSNCAARKSRRPPGKCSDSFSGVSSPSRNRAGSQFQRISTPLNR